MSCLKTPVDPFTKVPLALYERARAAPNNEQMESDSEFDPDTDEGLQDEVCCPLSVADGCKLGGHIDLQELNLSNKEYYRKLDQLRRAHLCTMADLKLMHIKSLNLKSAKMMNGHDRVCLLQHNRPNSMTKENLKKALSAHELQSTTYVDDVCNAQGDHINPNVSKGSLGSPKERIRNMWRGFCIYKKSSSRQQASSVSPENHPGDHQAMVESKIQRSNKGKGWRPQVTVPKPFQMTLRESKCKAVRSRAEIEHENEKLRRELEELTECQRKFRAAPMPSHVRLLLYEELRERDEERRREFRTAEQQRLLAAQKPFSFLEREQIKKQQKELNMLLSTKEQEKHKRRQFRAKPVPRAVKEAASQEREKEEKLYREIKKEMRATDMLLSATEPPSMLAKRLNERHARKEELSVDQKSSTITNHKNRFCSRVPDFDAHYRSFQKQLESKREFRPLTTCKPFNLRTANNSPCKERLAAKAEAERRSQSASMCLFVSLSPASSSVCSSASGSCEYLPPKITDAAKKRQEAVRKVLEQRKKAEQDEEKWKERQRQKEKKLQKLIAKRAQAYDPHVALAQICESKLKEFRKQDLQRRREYQEELREIQGRVKSRPLLLEQVTQMNAKRAAEKCYSEALRAFGLDQAFIKRNALASNHGCTFSGGSDIQSPHTHRKDKTAGDVENADSEDYSAADYPADYEDYKHDVEDVLMVRKNERKQEDEGENLDEEWDPNKDRDAIRSYEHDLDFDDYQEGDDCSHGRHSNTSITSDDGERKEDGKSVSGSQESEGGEETDECESGDKKNNDSD
ncbi:protein FAM161A isoform X1 [Silurus asotus]|uniref:Protein FAM161A n=1 Tax=Silurus asotus TaxID=30991 RepID=A0AAD5FRH5_SILAS|nr:protein FAM161A isoform X1 [Silurus asotus]